MGPRSTAHKWQFKARFRRHAFGWRSQPAVQRVKEAVSEIKKVARTDKVFAAEGAVSFLEKLSPTLEHVDGSSGAIGTAVNNAIEDLVPIIASAPADPKTRASWLDRLYEAHEQDEIPYIEQLAGWWGELCASPEVAPGVPCLTGVTGPARTARLMAGGRGRGSRATPSEIQLHAGIRSARSGPRAR